MSSQRGDKEKHEQPAPPVAAALLDPQLRRVVLIIGMMVIAAGVLGALALAWPFISMVLRTTLPFAVGLVFAYIFDPVVTFVQQRLRLSRVGGVLLLYLVFIAGFVAFFAVVLPILIVQVQNAYHGLSQLGGNYLQRLSDWLGLPPGQDMVALKQQHKGLLALLWGQLGAWAETQGIVIQDLFQRAAQNADVRNAAQTAASSGFQVVGDALTFFFSVVLRLIGGTTFLVFAILVNVYLLLDFSKLRDVLEILIPDQYEEKTFAVLHKVDLAVGGFIRGSLIVATIVGSMTFVGLYLLGLKQYALLIGIMAGFGNLVPYLGAIMGSAPALLYILFSDAYPTTQDRVIHLIGLAVMYGVIQGVEGFVLQPKIVGKSAQLHPIAVLFALAFGANFGIVGMILAVPTACIVRVLLKEFYWDRRQDRWARTSGKRYLGDWQSRIKPGKQHKIRQG